MSAYHRLISYIYAYEGGIKGKNTGFAKLETRGTSCRIQVSVRRVFAGGSPIGVYLLAGQEEIRIGTLFVRGGNGEFRAVVNCENIEGSGCNMEECCGLTLHETDSAWRAYTTIWEDAVAHAAEVELADVTAEKVREQEAEKEEATRKLAENVSGEVNSASVGKEKLDEASELTRSGEMENQDTSTETEKKEDVNINETDFGISQPQPEKLEDSNLEIFEDTETMEAVPDISETSDHQEAEVVQETQTETPQESFRNPLKKCKRRHRRKVFRNPIRKHRQRRDGKILKNPPGKSGKKCLQILHQTIKRHFGRTLKIKNNRNQIHPRNFRKKIPPSPSGTVCVLPIPK